MMRLVSLTRWQGFLAALVGMSTFGAPFVHAQGPTSGTETVQLSAVSSGVSDSGTTVRISIIRWSTDEERDRLVAALDSSRSPAPPAQIGRGGRGDGPPDGPGSRDRGGRGQTTPPLSAFDRLAAAIAETPTMGYFWTAESVVGLSIKYAHRDSLPTGGERIVLATNRRLDAQTTAWTPLETATSAATDYPFTVIEIRLDSTGQGRGKTSLSSAVVFDRESGTMFLDDYETAPVMLEAVRRR